MGQVARFTVSKTCEILHDLKLVLTSFITWLIIYPHGGWHHQWLLLHPTNCSHQRTRWREETAQEHACAQLLSSPSLASSYAPHRIDATVDVCVFLQKTELCFTNSFTKAREWLPAGQAEPGLVLNLVQVPWRWDTVLLRLKVSASCICLLARATFSREEEEEELGYLGFLLFKMKSTVHRGNTYLHMLIKYLHGNIQNTVIYDPLISLHVE